MKKISFLLAILLSGTGIYSQPVLTSAHHIPRDGDEIVKQQVEYKHPGRTGEHVLWDFSRLETINDSYSLEYLVRTDSLLAGIEHGTMYVYEQTGDSLLGWGFENPTTVIRNEQPELLMKFPVAYGDSTFSTYYGKGKYSDMLHLNIMGTITTKADAYGWIILPDKDTLRHVIRVHTVKRISEDSKPWFPFEDPADTLIAPVTADSIAFRVQNDSVVFQVENYRWYVRGYRYPVFETVKGYTDRQGILSDFMEVAFFYPPQDHYYLWNDKANMALWQDREEKEEKPELTILPGSSFSYNVYPNPAEDHLTIEYYIREKTPVHLALYDLNGVCYSEHTDEHTHEGIYRHELKVHSFLKGNYLLTISTKEETRSEIIIKK